MYKKHSLPMRIILENANILKDLLLTRCIFKRNIKM